MAVLRYLLRRPSPRNEATLAFLFETLGIEAAPATPTSLGDGPHLVHGEDTAAPNGIAIPDRPDDLIWAEVGRARAEEVASIATAAAPDGALPFDLVAAIGTLLDDRGQPDLGPADRDRHGRLRYDASVTARAGLGHAALVNRYVVALEALLRDRLGITGRPRWPDGKTAAIGLSHDVDLPDRYAMLGSAWRPWRLRRGPRTAARHIARLARRRIGDRRPADFWLFDQVADSEAELGLRSTFFFATVPFHHRFGALEDVAYDVRGRRYRDVLGRLRERDFEIGLHASYRAHETPDRLERERGELAAAADAPIAGVRHHYWNLGPDALATFRAQDRAGFTYDSSIAFNDHVGFRRSVALPFRPFDAAAQGPLRLLELPTVCMDGNLFYGSDDVDAAVTAVDAVVDEIVATGGTGALDWHIQASYPANEAFRPWAIAYQAIIRRLAARPEIWTTDLGSIARWVTERRAATASTPTAATAARP